MLVGPVVLVVGAHLEVGLEIKTEVRDRRQGSSSWLAILCLCNAFLGMKT